MAVWRLAPAFQVSQRKIDNISSENQALVITHLSQYKLHWGMLLTTWEDHLLFLPTAASDSVGSSKLLGLSAELIWVSLQNLFCFAFYIFTFIMEIFGEEIKIKELL